MTPEKSEILPVGEPEQDIASLQMPSRQQFVPAGFNQKILKKLYAAFINVCDLEDIEVAQRLALIMEQKIMRHPLKADGTRRYAVETLVAAHERLWVLRRATHAKGRNLTDPAS